MFKVSRFPIKRFLQSFSFSDSFCTATKGSPQSAAARLLATPILMGNEAKIYLFADVIILSLLLLARACTIFLIRNVFGPETSLATLHAPG